MAWVVFDRAVRLVEQFGLEAPVERWKRVRDEIHDEVCEHGYDPERQHVHPVLRLAGARRQRPEHPAGGVSARRPTSGSPGTIDAIARELGRDGFVSRYSTAETDDGLPGDEGQFLACSFWLVSALALNGRVDEARALFERLLGAEQRPRPAVGGVRRRAPAAGRQLPAGVQPPDPHRRGGRHRGRRVTNQPGPRDGGTDGGDPMKTVMVGWLMFPSSAISRLFPSFNHDLP